MRFSLDELHFIFPEISRVLKLKGFNFFSVRNQNDKSYAKGIEINNGIYDINGFQIRFFTEDEIYDLAEDFEILWLKEEYEEPVTLYLVSRQDRSNNFVFVFVLDHKLVCGERIIIFKYTSIGKTRTRYTKQGRRTRRDKSISKKS